MVKDAHQHNNRSRQAMVRLGWMDVEGKLTDQAHYDVKEALTPSTKGPSLV